MCHFRSRITVRCCRRRYFSWGIVGHDKEGYPVLVERTGRLDLIGVHASGSDDDFLQWVCWYHEVQESIMRTQSARAGADRHKMSVIVDIKGFSMRHMSSATLNVLKKRVRLEEDNYPEVVKRVFLVNVPAAFAATWGIIKYFLDDGKNR
jgi:hypothetical protein